MAENQHKQALKSIFAVAEAYPQLQASQNFLQLQAELVDTEDKIQASRRFYNGGVREPNTKIKVFPNTLFVRASGSTSASSSRSRGRGDRRAAARAVLAMYRAIARNKRNTVFTILLFLAIVGGLGYLAASVIYGDLTIVVGTLVIATAYALFQYFTADRQALSMSGAVEIHSVREHPRLWRTVENLSITTGTPMPRVFVISDPAPNAFATGRDPQHAVVAATTGLLEIMDDSELEGVMAHELGHVRNYDIRPVDDRVRARRGDRVHLRPVPAHGLLRPRQQWQPDRDDLRARRDAHRPARREPRATGGVASARVPGGCHGGDDHPAPRRARRRAPEARTARPSDAAPEHVDGAPLDRRPAEARRDRPPFSRRTRRSASACDGRTRWAAASRSRCSGRRWPARRRSRGEVAAPGDDDLAQALPVGGAAQYGQETLGRIVGGGMARPTPTARAARPPRGRS